MFPSLNKFINTLTLSSLDNSSRLSLLDMVEPHTQICIQAHTEKKKTMPFKNKNLLSLLFYTFTFLYIFTLLSTLFYCWFLLSLPAPLCAALLRQSSPCLESSGCSSEGDGQGRQLEGRRMLVSKLEATLGPATGLMGSGICREM